MANFLAFDYDDSDLQSAIDGLVDKLGGDLRPVMVDIGEYMLLATRTDRFDKQTAPDGSPWTPLKPSYAKAKAKKSNALDGILTLTGAMRDGITYEALPQAVVIGSNRIYAATHQFGRGPIAARPFLGVSETDAGEIREILRGYLKV
jgi:phage virion morphogenesis protein